MPNQHKVKLMRPYSSLVSQLPGEYPETVNIAIARYIYLVSTPPEFSENEWNLMRDVCKNWLISATPLNSLLQSLISEIEDFVIFNHADQEWDVDVPTLIDKLKVLSPVETIATIYAIERFWYLEDKKAEETEE